MPEDEKKLDLRNVLVVDDEPDMQDAIKRFLIKSGFSKDRIICLGDAYEALNVLQPKEAIKDARDHIHWLLCDIRLDSGDGGEILIEMVRHDIPNRPFITAISGIEQPDTIQSSIEGHADEFLPKDGDKFYQELLPESIDKVTSFFVDQARSEDDLADATFGSQSTENQEATTSADQVIPGENIYELIQSGALPDLRNPDSYPKGTKVVLLDVDGTLAREFVMGRLAEAFVLDSNWSKKFQELIGSLTPVQRKVNERALNRLYAVHKKSNEGIYLIDDKGTKGEYGEMIEYMNSLYAKTMARLRVDDVCKAVGEWAEEDVKRNVFKFTNPLLTMLKDFGFVTSLVTGMPTEALPAYQKAFGVEEAGHALLLATQREGEYLIYTGEIEDQGGTESSKKKIATDIQKHFDIALVIGNQSSDLGMMKVGMAKKANQENAPHGKALFVANMFASDFTGHIKNIKDRCQEEFKRGHLQFINFNPEDPDAGDTRFWILEHAATHIFRSERWYQYLEEVPEEVVGKVEETRNKVHEVVYHPKGKSGDETSTGYKKYLD